MIFVWAQEYEQSFERHSIENEAQQQKQCSYVYEWERWLCRVSTFERYIRIMYEVENIAKKKRNEKKHTKQYEVSALWYRLSNKHWVALITFIDRWPNERANIHTCELTHKYTRIASIYFKSTLCRKQLFFVLSTVCPANCFVDCGCSRLQWISLNTLLNNQERENKATKRTVTDR